VQAVGLNNEIRSTSTGAPEWQVIGTRPQVWVHTRDLMPYYQTGVNQFVISQQVNPSAAELALVPQAKRWIQEQNKTRTATQNEWIYDELFALDDNDQVIYSQQCISQNLCMVLTYLGEVKQP
jgi:hypothetical protein